MTLRALSTVAVLASLLAAPVMAQTQAMCANLGESDQWPKEREAVVAAPKNHRVVYESSEIRVLEVTVLPGEREQPHHHQWPSVMVVDSRPQYVNYDKDGKVYTSSVQAQQTVETPLMVRLPAQAEHAIQNIGDKPFHAVRIEYKKLCVNP